MLHRIQKYTLLFAFLPLLAFAQSPVIPSKMEIHHLVQSAQQYQMTGDKIAYLSRLFIDGKYSAKVAAGPLGEGAFCDYNCKPLYRLDAFDCTTFVEMMLALATADPSGDENYTMKSFENQVKELRYKSPDKISYLTRNHFPEVDWIPHNTRPGGLLTDITGGLGIDPVETPPALIDKKNWYAHRTLMDICVWDMRCSAPKAVQEEKLVQLKAVGKSMQNERVTILYVPTAILLASQDNPLAKIPTGSVVQFIRPSWNEGSTHMHVAHQGIVVQEVSGTWLHHASSHLKEMNRVKLAEYLAYHQQCAKKRSPEMCVQGINILKPAL